MGIYFDYYTYVLFSECSICAITSKQLIYIIMTNESAKKIWNEFNLFAVNEKNVF